MRHGVSPTCVQQWNQIRQNVPLVVGTRCPKLWLRQGRDQGRKEEHSGTGIECGGSASTNERRGAANNRKASPGVGADGFHSKVPLDLGSATCGKTGIIGKRWGNAATGQFKSARFSFFFRGRSRVRDQLTLNRWREWPRAPVIRQWMKVNVDH